MNRGELEARLAAVIAPATEWLREEQVADMLSLVRAGEAGVALENYCTQLFEYDVQVPESIWSEVQIINRAMGLDNKYWLRLERSTEEK